MDDKYFYKENLEVFGNSKRQMSMTFPVSISYDSQRDPSLLARTNHSLYPCSPTHDLFTVSPLSPLPIPFTSPDPIMTSQATVSPLSLLTLIPVTESPCSSLLHVPLPCFLTH